MQIFFVRHGESEANLPRVFSNRGWKHPLTANGRAQAQQLAEKLQNRGISTILTSQLRRAIETAQIISARLNVPYQIEPALVEYDVGVYEDRSDDEAWKCYADVTNQWLAGDLQARMDCGESCREICDRVLALTNRLIEQFKDSDDAIVLVGHGGTFGHALPRVLANVSHDFAIAKGLSPTSIVESELRDGQLVCLSWDGSPPA